MKGRVIPGSTASLLMAVMILGCGCGEKGDPGPMGTACWDLNDNAECDVDSEDIDGDGACTAADCGGVPGPACWDLNGNGACDPADEDVDGDGSCSASDCSGNPGTACWDLNDNGDCDAAAEDLSGDGDCTVADCSTAGVGTLEGSVVDEAGTGIDGAAIDIEPGGASTAASAAGEFTIALAVGVYTVTASAAGYESASVENASIPSDGLVTLEPIVLVAENPVTADAGADQAQVGYGEDVTLSGSGSGASSLTYAWEQTGGPTVTITGADTATPTVTMPTIEEAFEAAGRGLPDRTQLLPIAPATQGSVTLQLTVSGDGFEQTDTVTLTAAEPTGAVLAVPPGVNVFFVAAEAGSYSWSLTAPGTSSTTLTGASTRTPSFVPDVEGTYTITIGSLSFDVEAGTYEGAVNNSSCTSCHDGDPGPDMFTPWSETNHSTMFARGIDGLVSSHYGEGCLSCHTTGFNAGTNGGFDDVAASEGWTFPSTLEAGNWDAMTTSFPEVAQLGNIQCENCHGPHNADHMGGASRMSMSAGMCGTCHDAPTHHVKNAEWATALHSDLELAREEATWEGRGTSAGHCGRCHAGNGYIVYAERLMEGLSGSFTGDEAYFRGLGMEDARIEPVTCQACHDPHSAENPHQLRLYGDIPMLPSGFGVEGVGAGATCMACHNTRNGLHDDGHLPSGTSYSGPHYPAQADVLMGYNAYFVGAGGYGISGHAAIGDTCVACHMAESEEGPAETGAHTWRISEEVCAGCHGEGVTGEAIMGQVEIGLHAIEEDVLTQLVAAIDDQLTTDGNYTIRAWNSTTDCYSSNDSGTSDVTMTEVPTAVTEEHIHGQVGFCFTVPTAVSVTWASEGCSGTESLNTLCFQLSSLKRASDQSSLIPNTDVLFLALWNVSLLLGDGSYGIHNPGWVLDVLEATYEAVLDR